jgi:hypothetical protein
MWYIYFKICIYVKVTFYKHTFMNIFFFFNSFVSRWLLRFWMGNNFFLMPQQPPVGQGLLIIEASQSHSDTPHSVGLLWTSDQPDAGISTWQHPTLTTDRYLCRQLDSHPQSQQANGRRHTPQTVRPIRSALLIITVKNIKNYTVECIVLSCTYLIWVFYSCIFTSCFSKIKVKQPHYRPV